MKEPCARRAAASLLSIAIGLLVLFGGVAHAQGRAEGSIAGTVTDTTKGVLPGVTVKALNVATGFSRESVTEADGTFRLSALPPGTYEVATDLQGFAATKRAVTVTVGAEVTIDVVLAVAGLEEAVTVSGTAPLVEVTKTEQAVTFSSNEIENLPTNSRNFLEFAMLSPGVVRGRSSGAGWGSDGGFSASGNRGDQNAINIDGLVNKSLDNGLDLETFSQEGVQEFQIITQAAPAEFRGTAGGVVNAVTKSGTNVLSGYAYSFLRDDAFDKPPFDLRTGTDGVIRAVPAAQANEFRRVVGGITLGGPIRKDKILYFGMMERVTSNTPRVRTTSAAALAAVKALVNPNLPDDDTNKVTQFKPESTRGHIKVDLNLSKAHTASVRWSGTGRFNPSGTASGNTSVTNASQSTYRNYTLGFTLNSVLSASRLNTLRGQHYSDDNRLDWPHLGGYQNVRNFSPQVIIGGASGGTFGRGNAGGIPIAAETRWEIQDTFSLYPGKHTIKIGGQYLFAPFLQVNDYGPDGQWRFNDLNAFLAGRPSSFLQAWGPGGSYQRNHYISVFAQDEWQPSNKVTISYGVRYQLDRYPTDIASYELPEPAFTPTSGEFTTRAGAPNMKGFINDTNNVMPRLGLTFTPDAGKTVVRAGGGVFYGNNYIGEMGNGMGWDGAPGQQKYTFTSAQAREIWNGVLDPRSPYYNPAGVRRLPNTYFDVMKNAPFTRVPFNPVIKTPSSIQANLGAERQLTKELAVSATYLWSHGFHNIRSVNTNPQANTFYSQGSVLPSGVVAPFDVNFRLGPRPDPRFDEVLVYTNMGKVRFQGLSVAATARWPNLAAKVSYTYNNAWDDSVAISFTQGPSDLECTSCEFSQSVQWAKRLVGSVVYQTPQSWPLVARDFQVGGIVQIEAGHPYMVVPGFDFNNDTIATDRPKGVPRNALFTDPYRNVDLRISRNIRLKGQVHLEVLFEMFNLFNTANYSSYADTLYMFSGGRYVPRPDFATFAASSQLNVYDAERTATDIGLDPKIRRTGVGSPFQGQLGFRFRF